jgi:hypothetical protein
LRYPVVVDGDFVAEVSRLVVGDGVGRRRRRLSEQQRRRTQPQTPHAPRVLQKLQARLLAPLSASVLEPHLHARLGQVDAQRHLFAQKHVRVVRLLEQRLQFLQLLRRERRPVATLL